MSQPPPDAGKKEKPLTLAEYMANFQNLLEPGHIPSMTKEWKPKIPYPQEVYLTPEELKKQTLHRPRLQITVVEEYAKKNNLSHKAVEKKIKEILNEIGLGRSLPIIRWCGMCITQVSKRISTGIYVNEANLNKVKKTLGTQPVLYLPSHRSYCDFILMSYICFHYDIEIPGIAAGMDFHGMVGMGNLLRKTGAFFMRRSFTGDDLYWDVFREYVHALICDYHIGIEFFIEGTRSRNFKALVPKVGLLSMALEPLFLSDVHDITIVPVSVSYERLLEEQLFAYELLGVPKPKESTKGFFKALKIIDERFGRMYVDFGEPICVREYFGERLDRIKFANNASYLQKIGKYEIGLVKEMGFEVVYQQQRRIVITTFNLISLYYAYKAYLGHKISLEQLCNGVLFLKDLFEYLGAHLAVEEKSLKMDVIETVEVHSNILNISVSTSKVELSRPLVQTQAIDSKLLKGHKLSESTMSTAVPVFSLQLYINPCMFWLASPSLMVLSALKLSSETSAEIQKDQLRIRCNELRSIFANEFVFVPNKEEEDFCRNLENLQHFKVFEIKDRILVKGNEISDIMLSSIAPFLCNYFQTVETMLEKFANKEFTEKELLIATQIRVEELLAIRAKYTHPFCLSLDNISVSLSSLAQNSFVTKAKTINSAIIYKYDRNNELIQLRNTLLQYCRLLPFSFYDNFNVLSKL